jgi:hypothetical protein
MPVDVVSFAVQRVALRDLYLYAVKCGLHRFLSFLPGLVAPARRNVGYLATFMP